MSSVSVTINGKNYRMACEDGQEAHLEKLAEYFDNYVNHLKGSFGEIGDQRLAIMAAIMVTDELLEERKRNSVLEQDLKTIRESRETVSRQREAGDDELARNIEEAANRIEQLCDKLSVVDKVSSV